MPSAPAAVRHPPRQDDGRHSGAIAGNVAAAVRSDAKGKQKAAEPSASLLHRLAGPSTGKAGLLRDPDEVAKIIYENSVNSKFFLAEQEKDRKLTQDIERLLKTLETRIESRSNDLRGSETEADRICAVLEQSRILDRVIVCVDADAFYASVEERDSPELKDKPFAVGGGVLTTANYVARRWGCRSAMPGFIAKKLCPSLIFVKPDFTKYTAASTEIFTVLRKYDPTLSGASLDEAFMDLTSYCEQHKLSPSEATQKMRDEVKEAARLTVSAGVGPNAMIAKIAADMHKPNGQCVVEPTREAAMAFMKPLKVRKVPGIGRVTERVLEALGVVAVDDIFSQRSRLALLRSEVGMDHLLRAYLGLGSTTIQPGKREDRKSVGSEQTFDTLWQSDDLRGKLSEIANDLAADLERSKFSGRTLTLKYKLDTFQVYTRAITLGSNIYVSSATELFKQGWALLNHEIQGRKDAYERLQGQPGRPPSADLRLRLLGLKVSNLRDELSSAPIQANPLEKWAIRNPEEPQVVPTVVEPTHEPDHERLLPCPACGAKIPAALQLFNEHLDACLDIGSSAATASTSSHVKAKKRVSSNEKGKHAKRGRSIADYFVK